MSATSASVTRHDWSLAEVKALVEQGVSEVTLLGQNVNAYGVEFGDRQAFSKLLRSCGEIDGLEFAYLSGNEGPQVESRSGWDVDGVEIRVILDFGAGFIDHRGWFMNAGA